MAGFRLDLAWLRLDFGLLSLGFWLRISVGFGLWLSSTRILLGFRLDFELISVGFGLISIGFGLILIGF